MNEPATLERGHGRVLLARVGNEQVAFPLDALREVLDAPQVRALPLAPSALAGHLTLRDLHLPVLRADVLLGIPPSPAQAGVALIFADGFALLVDEADDLWERDVATAVPVPAGSDRVGVLQAILHRNGVVAGLVDSSALIQRALASLREHLAQ